MEEMEGDWETKLKKAQEQALIDDELKDKEEELLKAGKPHLTNLNEDPMLDRKVKYMIMPEVPVICGKRSKDSTHVIKLGGIGICKDHVKFLLGPNQTFVFMTPLDPKAPENIRVNGVPCKDCSEVKLRPNDRITIGPSAMFLYKNVEHDDEASMPDPVDDPISFDFAD